MRVLLTILSLSFLTGHRPVINYSVEIYLVPHQQSKATHSIPKEFDVKKEDLPTMPFIIDDEIESFDTANYRITFSKEAAKRIGALKPNLSVGIPFVLTLDREPVLTGYFVNTLSSFSFGAYVLLNTTQTVQKLRRGLPEHRYKTLITEKRKNFLVIQALERTGRLR